jgi:hypothetical protein
MLSPGEKKLVLLRRKLSHLAAPIATLHRPTSGPDVPQLTFQPPSGVKKATRLGRKRNLAGSARMAIIHEPTTLEEALASEQAELWQQAADDEMTSLLANGTWELEELPPGVKPIPVKWVFKVKRDASGNIERYKARLVAKGFRQCEGIDYEEVFAPVSKYVTVRALLALAGAQNLEIHQLDIKTAFLYGKLEEDVWIQQPRGYETGGPNMACHLRKSLRRPTLHCSSRPVRHLSTC